MYGDVTRLVANVSEIKLCQSTKDNSSVGGEDQYGAHLHHSLGTPHGTVRTTMTLLLLDGSEVDVHVNTPMAL